MNNKTILATLAGAILSPIAAHAFSYTNDFEGAVGPEWSTSQKDTTPVGNRQYLGQFGNDTVTLTLTNVPLGQVTVGFDLFIIDSWDGNSSIYGTDRMMFAANGNNQLDATFSNVKQEGWEQSFPDAYGSGSHPARTGADEQDSLGYTFYGDSVYKFGGANNAAFTFVNTSSTLTLSWTATGLQGIGDESWGIDNVNVAAVPEPTSMLAMAVGLVGAAAARRRRK